MKMASPTASAACAPVRNTPNAIQPNRNPTEPAVCAAQVHVVAARLRHHRGDLRIGEGAGERQQSRGDPHQHDDLGAAHVAGHDARLQEDSRADHIGDVDGNRRPRADAPGQLGPRNCRCASRRFIPPVVSQDMPADSSRFGPWLSPRWRWRYRALGARAIGRHPYGPAALRAPRPDARASRYRCVACVAGESCIRHSAGVL